MKKLALLVVSLTFFSSCKKESDPKPELTGLYQVSQVLNTEGELIEFPVVKDGKVWSSATMEVTRPAENRIDLTLKGVNIGVPQTLPIGLFTIQQNGEQSYDIYIDNSQIGLIDGTNLYLNLQGKSAYKHTMIATLKAKK